MNRLITKNTAAQEHSERPSLEANHGCLLEGTISSLLSCFIRNTTENIVSLVIVVVVVISFRSVWCLRIWFLFEARFEAAKREPLGEALRSGDH